MDFTEYQKIKKRMTKSENTRVCTIPCTECPLSDTKNTTIYSCREIELLCPEKAVEIIANWAKKHPVKTRQSEFLKMFPNTRTEDYNGKKFICICPIDLREVSELYCKGTDCNECKEKFWLSPIE